MTTYVCSPAVFSVFGAVYLTRLLLCFATALEMENLKKEKIPWLFDRKQLPDITLLTKVCLVKAMVFLVVTFRCESWILGNTEHGRIDALELWCWVRLLNLL